MALALWPALRSTLRHVFDRSRLEREMEVELQFHIDAYAEDLVRQGMPPTEALRRARIEFGGVEGRKEECRQSVGLRLWDEARADLRYGARVLRQNPAFTAVAVLSLALGIGANTAIYTLAREILFKPLAVPHPEQLRIFSWAQSKQGHVGPLWGNFDRAKNGETLGTPFPYPLFLEMRKSNRAFENMTAFHDLYRLTANIDGTAEALDATLVAGNFYSTLWCRVIAGRALGPDDDTLSATPVGVISDAYWAERFARSAAALGKTIRVNGVAVTIVGVNGPEFHGPKAGGSPQILLPLSLQPRVSPMGDDGSLLADNHFWWVVVLGRLKPGIGDAAAQAALEQSFRSALQATLPGKKAEDLPRFVLGDGRRGLDLSGAFEQPILVLLALAGIVLLVACANLANLLLARSAARQREMSVRLAMGAGRWRILRQVMTEALLLATLGGAAGLLAGYAGRNAIPSLFDDAWTAHAMDVRPDARVFLFALALTLVTGILFGIAPAWRATRGDVQSGLKENARTSPGRSRARLGKSLVAVQVALCAVLLVGAGLFLRTLSNLRHLDLGLSIEHLVLFQLDPPQARFAGRQRVELFQRIEDRLAEVPGVQLATLSSEALLAHSMDNSCFRPTGRVAGSPAENSTWVNHVGEKFFDAYAIRLLSGRGFEAGDRADAPRVGVVNQKLARKFFPEGAALGKTITECDRDATASPILVVGVSADAKYSDLREDVPPTLYLPYRQAEELGAVTFEVKTAATVASVAPGLRDAVRAVDSDLPLLDVRTQNQQVEAILSQERVFATLATGFGILALVLAGIGIYGVMAYTVSSRTNEIGIRLALGARAQEVLSMVLRETSVFAIAGIAAGLIAAFALTRMVTSMLYGLQATDPLTYLGAAFILFAIALVSGLIPARRAAHVDTMQALRHE
ncbi:MAG: ABC transporter permease [Acidobacteriota bacterium]